MSSPLERFNSFNFEENEKWKLYLSNIEFPSNCDVSKKTEELKRRWYERSVEKIPIEPLWKKEITEEAEGKKPVIGDTISVHYTGKLQNGTIFDSSYKRNQPIQFQVGRGMVIKGWDEGLLTMNVGEKATLTIQPKAGYGEREIGNGTIPSNSVLIFEVFLVSIDEVKHEHTHSENCNHEHEHKHSENCNHEHENDENEHKHSENCNHGNDNDDLDID